MGSLSSSHKSESLRANLRSAVSRGFHTGNLPFGYTYPPPAVTELPAVVVEHEAIVVREAFRLALAGHSLAEIAFLLQKSGLRGRNGYLSKSSIYSMLTNPFYAGMVRLNGELYPARHQSLVGLAEFGRVSELLGKRKTVPLHIRLEDGILVENH